MGSAKFTGRQGEFLTKLLFFYETIKTIYFFIIFLTGISFLIIRNKNFNVKYTPAYVYLKNKFQPEGKNIETENLTEIIVTESDLLKLASSNQDIIKSNSIKINSSGIIFTGEIKEPIRSPITAKFQPQAQGNKLILNISEIKIAEV